MEKFLKFLLALAMMLLPLMLKAQNCTEIYGQALEIRKTRTVEAQQKAITLFEQARECFTEQSDIDNCNRQIDLCAKSIRRMGGEPVLTPQAPRQAPVENVDEPDQSEEESDAALSVEAPTASLELHANAKDNTPVIIHLQDLTGLEIGEHPEWVIVNTDSEANTVTVSIENNPEKKPRQHTLTIKTPAINYSIAIEQAAKKGIL